MTKITMYSTRVCPYCVMAERLLVSKGVEITEKILVDVDSVRREEMMARTGRRTVPQIFIGEMDKAGKLDPLLGK
jgi:glutaredoxin 3